MGRPGGPRGALSLGGGVLCGGLVGPAGNAVAWEDARSGKTHVGQRKPRQKKRLPSCACRAFKLSDKIYSEWSRNLKDRWKVPETPSKNSAYDLWMHTAIWWFARGWPAPCYPAYGNMFAAGRPGHYHTIPPPDLCLSKNTAPFYGNLFATFELLPTGSYEFGLVTFTSTHFGGPDVDATWSVVHSWDSALRTNLRNTTGPRPQHALTIDHVLPDNGGPYVWLRVAWADWRISWILTHSDVLAFGTP